MSVEADSKEKFINDMDDDDDEEPLVFKRSSSSSKHNQASNSETKKTNLTQKNDRQSARPVPSQRSQNGQLSGVQRDKVMPVSKEPPITSPSSSSKATTSSKSSRDPAVKPDNDSEDSEDDKPLSMRRAASKVSSKNGNGEPKASSLSETVPKREGPDDKKALLLKSWPVQNVGASTSKSYNSDERKPLPAKALPNGYSLTNCSLKKPSSMLNKRPASDVNSANASSVKKPKLSGTPIPINKNQGPKHEPKAEDGEEDDGDHVPISQRMQKPAAPDKKLSSSGKVSKEVKEEDDDNVPISQRLKKQATPDNKVSSAKKPAKVVSSSMKKVNKMSKKVMKNSKYSKSSKVPPGSGEGQKWTTLEHNGVIFPPPYKPHGVKMLYKGKPVDLTPEQEEVATMFAVMLDTEYMNKPKFKENFMADWRKILGKKHVIQNLEDCDFTPIYEWHQKEKEKKKQMSSEEKKALREEKLKQEEKYMWAIVNGVKEKVGNFRVEPPGLFRGRGEHPKMGKLKRRIRPSDITINIGKGAPIPECPIPGESWKEIRHDNTVTWLAFWNDPINQKEFKYVFLAASSTLKGQSDKEKYEKARLLKDYIHGIRSAYTKDFASKDATKKQIAVATYLIDKLALRAGNEKDDDEADTVGCCTLKVENVEPMPPNTLKFDFLGKDSIRYQNEVEVELPVFKAIQQFRHGKKGGEDLFDKLDTSKLNAHLKELMPGLTAKVFRTYNASITLDEMLSKETKGGDIAEKVVVYQHANKEVAIICNHQRTVSKSHSAQMLRLNEKIEELEAILEELETDLSRAKKGKPPLKSSDGKPKRNLNPESLEKKIAQTTAKIEKMKRDKETKEDLKTVALGTSKINYLDPRITVAWCKRYEVPIEKIFNKSLLAKFTWAMDVDPSFRF